MKKQELSVLADPKINHSLNLSMTTSDLIELYIEENIQRLEKEYDNLVERFKSLKEDKSATSNKILDHYKKIKLPFKVVSAVFECSTLDTKEFFLPWGYFRGDETFQDFVRSGFSVSDQKLTYGNQYVTFIRLSGLVSDLELRASDIPEDLRNLPKSEEQVKYRIEQISAILQSLENIKQEYKELNNTRRVKAKFTKKALSNTTEGSKILEFLSQIDSIKALS